MEPLTDGLTVAKAVKIAKGAFDYFRARAKATEDVAKLMELQDAFQTLREDNTRLRDELRECHDSASARNAFQQRQIGNAVVLVHVGPDGTDGPPCCPNCQDAKGNPLPLQGLAPAFRSMGSHRCTSCDATFNISRSGK